MEPGVPAADRGGGFSNPVRLQRRCKRKGVKNGGTNRFAGKS